MHCALRGKSPTVTTEKTFTVDPWCLREPELDLDVLASTEAVLTVANGNLGVRGTLDEGEPVGHPGHVPGRRARAAHDGLHGDRQRRPRSDRDVGEHDRRHRRPLAGRRAPARRAHRHAAAPRARARLPRRHAGAPAAVALAGRTGASRSRPPDSSRWISGASSPCATPCAPWTSRSRSCCSPGWSPTCESRTCPTTRAGRTCWRTRCEAVEHDAVGRRLTLMHRTDRTELLVGATAEHEVESSAGVSDLESSGEADPDQARFSVRARLEPGRVGHAHQARGLRLVGHRGVPALRDELAGALTVARNRASTASSRTSARSSTTSGSARTSRSTATPSCSRPSGSPCSSSCRPRRAPRVGGSRARR